MHSDTKSIHTYIQTHIHIEFNSCARAPNRNTQSHNRLTSHDHIKTQTVVGPDDEWMERESPRSSPASGLPAEGEPCSIVVRFCLLPHCLTLISSCIIGFGNKITSFVLQCIDDFLQPIRINVTIELPQLWKFVHSTNRLYAGL